MLETVQKFVVDCRINVFRDASESAVDEGIVKSVKDGSVAGSTRQMEVRSLVLCPGQTHQYGLFSQGWKMLFRHPVTGTYFHSGEKGPVFRFEL
jgi:hypothetical protein